jgi:hypothetical protein
VVRQLLPHSLRDTFCRQFHVTTSGSFSDKALALCIAKFGIDRVIFAVETPPSTPLAKGGIKTPLTLASGIPGKTK